MYALPLGISELAAGIVWVSIFTQSGWLNSVLMGIGIFERPITWQSAETPWLLIGIVVIAEAWRATLIIMIILVAGLQSIPREFLEAADVYGATTWQKVRRVVLPMLRPSLQVALILRTILAFQVFATESHVMRARRTHSYSPRSMSDSGSVCGTAAPTPASTRAGDTAAVGSTRVQPLSGSHTSVQA